MAQCQAITRKKKPCPIGDATPTEAGKWLCHVHHPDKVFQKQSQAHHAERKERKARQPRKPRAPRKERAPYRVWTIDPAAVPSPAPLIAPHSYQTLR